MKNCRELLVRFGLATVMIAVVTVTPAKWVVAKSSSAKPEPKLLADYKAANYHPKTGIWDDSSGNHSNAARPAGVVAPTLQIKATVNGSSAVSFNGKAQYLKIINALPSSHGYTVVVFAEPKGTDVQKASAIVAGGPGSLEYRIQTMSDGRNKQVLLKTATTAFGASHSAVPTKVFSMVAVATDNTGNGTFYLNGHPDGTFSGHDSFTQSIWFIGAAATGPGATPAEFFRGDIAELRVYSGVLTPRRIKALAAFFEKTYVGNH
ncbi:MAG: LamG-like jellyroll fold domain-containing protein [Phycisphaerae bacterium]